MAKHIWLSVPDLALICGISRQSAHAAVKASAWRGQQLMVRSIQGRGGKSGLRYEVLLSSLPEALQRAFKGDLEDEPSTAIVPYDAPSLLPVPASNQGAKIAARWRVLEPIANTLPNTLERGEAKREACRIHGIPLDTLNKWVGRAERSGWDVNALAHQRPADAGKARKVISRKFDKAFLAMGGDRDTLEQLGAKVAQLIKAAWASPAQRAGYNTVRKEVITAFQRHCREKGIAIPRIVDISDRTIKGESYFRIVDIKAHDSKRFDDTKPRIRRDNSKLMPMAQIVMDVKPLDNIVLRPDGTTTWPKMIAFQDTGTQRLFAYIVLLNKGEGVRQEHVIEAFLEMVSHPEWGFPSQLYRDNGTEFAVFDMIRDGIAMVAEEGAKTIVNAKPYNGAAKPIESKFATLDRLVFSQMGGWAGGNRMNKKTQTVGKPPKPYPGTFEEFAKEAIERIAVYEHDPIGSGPFKGRSPQEVYADHVAAGWRPVSVNTNALDASFCKRDTRRIDRGTIRIGSVVHRHPELARANSQRVSIALPYRRGAWPLASLPGVGWVYLEPDMYHLPGDISGAIEASRIQQANARATRDLGKVAGKIDLAANHRDRVTALPTRAAPAPLIDVMMSDEAERFAGARIEAQRQHEARPSAEQRLITAQLRETEDIERYLNAKRR